MYNQTATGPSGLQKGNGMQTQIIRVITKVTLLSAMIILTSVGSAHGQSLANGARFNIPFDFAFGENKLPAGKYSIGRALPSSGDTMLALADGNGRSKAILLSQAAMRSRPNTLATLVFHRYGDQYFLVQVWPAGAESGREFPASKLERQVYKQLTSNPSATKVARNEKPQTVVVIADLQ